MTLSPTNTTASCSGKTKLSAFRAHAIAKRMNRNTRRRKTGEIHIEPYRCPVCSQFHVGRTNNL